ncbi:MAG: DNA primase [Anaerolineae bacterium]
MSVTTEIKSRLDIVDIVSDYVSLRKSGRSYAGFCPFHANTRTPAFYVFPETQTWHCFGACSEGGDLFSFIMKKEGWEFKEALRRMADRAGVVLEEATPVDKQRQAVEQKQAALLSAAADYFHQLLLHAPQAEHACQYVAGRGLNADTVSTFSLGYALNSWNACRTHFNGQGYTDQELLDVGLLTENPDKGTRYDRFRNRFMIPIRDVSGRVVGFGARALDDESLPKYLNSPQTALFDKSHLLFGLDTAKRHIREARQVVIVEGYLDVMQAWQAGHRNVVAQMGTALTEAQLRKLKPYTRRFVLALDADAAGFKATMRGLQVARETLDREVEVRFDAHGLVRHEGRLKADIQVITLPEGYDPDKIIREDPARWPKLVSQSKPVVAYVIDVATRDLDLNDAKQKAAVAQQVLPLIKDIVDPVERNHYWQQLARALHVDERSLRQIRLPGKRRPVGAQPALPATHPAAAQGKTREAPPPDRTTRGLVHKREENYLSHCLRFPQLISLVNQRLVENKQPVVSESDFAAAEDRVLLKQIVRWAQNGSVASIDELCDSLDEALLDRVQVLLSTPPTSNEWELGRMADKLALSVLDWRQDHIGRLISEVKQLFREKGSISDTDSREMYEKLDEWKLAVLSIHRAKNAMSATNQRRAADAAQGRF